jgi:N6-adenosine-specific RNA methylase IME4
MSLKEKESIFSDVTGAGLQTPNLGTPGVDLPSGKYGCIYADPPWAFAVRSRKGEGRSASRHYSTMSLDDIKALPVADLAAPDCVLIMWVTDPFLRLGFDVLEAWGFQYKTVAFYWAKQNKNNDDWFMGGGYWSRANPEQALLATRGSPKRLAKDVRRLVVSRRREHSRKPDEIYPAIERLVAGPYCELFARQQRPGWSSWGLETSKFDAVA